jgi:TRAP-type C4-dicarboxylate transport system permease small subunit
MQANPLTPGVNPKNSENSENPPGQEPKTRVPLAIEDVLGAVCMGVLALITFANVVLRYFTDESIAWTEEISIALMVVMSLAAASAAVARERHIRIDYFLERGSDRRKRILALIGSGSMIVLFVVMTVLSARVVWDEFSFGETSPGIGVPKWWYTVWLPLLSAAISGRAAGLFMRQWRSR